ncbi:hypothetical protein [Alkaliphilus serpentinus]|uniref:Uncharacterized protein n=1 Tax=Alkaliphilus serpentinus TaxID=1482731 RepID=A0A833HM89_9FIRM|nr:hypothetical protein [Alkaliphilus serpentinus]KAB3527246.1 hypothetical protein F8153_12665 [Alkaliphilus serpentinus]
MSKNDFKSIIIVILVFLNIFFYSQYKSMSEKAQQITNIASLFNDLKYEDFQQELKDKTVLDAQNKVSEIINKVKKKDKVQSSWDRYIIIKYADKDTLMVNLIPTIEGDYVIRDMFFLNEDTYDKLRYKK